MNDDRARVLRMVAEGKVTAEEGATLLDALEPPRTESLRPAAPAEPAAPQRPGTGRLLVIRIEDAGESKVHLRIPLGLAKAASRFVPREAQSRLAEHDINLEQLLEDLATVSTEGPLLHIEDGDDRVQIAVE